MPEKPAEVNAHIRAFVGKPLPRAVCGSGHPLGAAFTANTVRLVGFSAMEQQLGLRMQKTKPPVDMMVIDKIEKPSSN